MSVSVVTPSLNKSFKFQSDWPYNNSQVYLLNSVLEDLEEDEERTFESNDKGFVFTSKVNYPNNRDLVKQNVYMDKNSKITKVEVVDDDNNVLILMNYNKIEYDKDFDDDYFELGSIIKSSDNKKDITSNKENTSTNDKDDNTKENITDNSDANTESNTNTESDNTSNTNDNKNNSTSNGNTNSATNNSDSTSNSETGSNVKTKETLSIEDVIYPMYLPDNTYLTGQDRIATETGERLILTFGGDNSFVLVEETISSSDSNLVIPVSGEFDFLSDVIGVIGTNSVMWHSNGIEYYMTSSTLETGELVDIARSISVLPVSK